MSRLQRRNQRMQVSSFAVGQAVHGLNGMFVVPPWDVTIRQHPVRETGDSSFSGMTIKSALTG